MTSVQKSVLAILKDKSNWKPPSSRTIAVLLKKKGHMGIEYALASLRKKGLINERNIPIN